MSVQKMTDYLAALQARPEPLLSSEDADQLTGRRGNLVGMHLDKDEHAFLADLSAKLQSGALGAKTPSAIDTIEEKVGAGPDTMGNRALNGLFVGMGVLMAMALVQWGGESLFAHGAHVGSQLEQVLGAWLAGAAGYTKIPVAALVGAGTMLRD